ncbi:VOC family protein [Dyadobacter sp. NIV53]|uniref:VOC family protein n=1 Tax=Dyadobacter sp. NIV53 TaxID=2861765 RepID=UPI001C87DDAB|nr:VOC family protein [Dyadobacter sp. NIV53]
MAVSNVYLNFPGNAEEAFDFYKSVLGGEFHMVQRFGDTPHGDQLPEEEKKKIMHISLPIGAGTMIMASDAIESMGQKLTIGNNFYICLSPDSEEDADQIFNGLSAGGKVEMGMEKTFWGAYFGSFADKFGVHWMVNYEYNQH